MSVSRRAGPPHSGTDRIHERRELGQGRAALLRDLDLLGQQDRELIIGHGNDAVLVAIEHGDGRAPVALAADAPILQAEGDGRLAKAMLLGERGQLLLRLLATQSRCTRRS